MKGARVVQKEQSRSGAHSRQAGGGGGGGRRARGGERVITLSSSTSAARLFLFAFLNSCPAIFGLRAFASMAVDGCQTNALSFSSIRLPQTITALQSRHGARIIGHSALWTHRDLDLSGGPSNLAEVVGDWGGHRASCLREDFRLVEHALPELVVFGVGLLDQQPVHHRVHLLVLPQPAHRRRVPADHVHRTLQ